MKTLAQTAVEFAEDGLAVFPCHSVDSAGRCSCGKGDCGRSAGKHPRIAHGLKDASKNVATVKAWWAKWPDANIGLPTGSINGLVVVDVDGADGEASLQALPPLPETREASTGREDGGRHKYFAYTGSDIRNDTGRRLGKGIDVRGDGGYVIAPPSPPLTSENGWQTSIPCGTRWPRIFHGLALLPAWQWRLCGTRR